MAEKDEYSAYIGGTIKCYPYIPESIGFEGFKILQKLGLTVFKIELSPSILPGKSRILKVSFRPKRTMVDKRSLWETKALAWIRKRRLTFEIMGPFDILEIFREKLSVIGKEIPNNVSNLDQELWEKYIGHIQKDYIKEGCDSVNTRTSYYDYRLQIYTIPILGVTMNFTPRSKGEIFECEPFPDYCINDLGRSQLVYQYITGQRYCSSYETPFKFRIVIQTGT